jgi:2-oxoglutarate ferredoxin oxidoreductase subunit alpha
VVDDRPRASVGLIAYGSTHWAIVEARDILRERGVETAYCRLRALPFADEVLAFAARYDRIYVVEQNRDGQVYNLLRAAVPGRVADRMVSVTNYDGTPASAAAILGPILDREHAGTVAPPRRVEPGHEEPSAE